MIAKSDIFISLDDVNMRKKGFIHRNYIIHRNEKYQFTIPIKNISQNKKINETFALDVQDFCIELLRKMEKSYKHCSHYNQLQFIFEQQVEYGSELISDMALKSIKSICKALNINTKILKSSEIETYGSVGESKIITLCEMVGAKTYFNLPSGVDLYQPAAFEKAQLELRFLSIDWNYFAPFLHDDGSPLSILDTIARFSFDDISAIIHKQARGNENV